MKWLSRILTPFSLPLLTKELIELSARKSTFIFRTVFAVSLIFFSAMFVTPEVYGRTLTPANILGTGKRSFNAIINMAFCGILLFMPATACSVISIEKERNTLGLLLQTRLGPWTIIFEKFTSRLIPMLSCLAISLPLLGFCYSLGGLETLDLVHGVWFLLISVLLTSSIAIMASAFCRTTMAAFITSYTILFVFSFGPAIIDSLFLNDSIGRWTEATAQQSLTPILKFNARYELLGTYPFMPMALCDAVADTPIPLTWQSALVRILIFSATTLLAITLNLGMAKYFLVRRAFLSPLNPILRLFRLLDRFYSWANGRYGRGVVLLQPTHLVPDLEPIAWRETTKRSLGQARYLIRIFVVLQFSVCFMLCVAAISGKESSGDRLWIVVYGTWFVTLLLIAISACGLIAAERQRETLDVLLTTPLSSREIIDQKLAGTRRVLYVCTVPLATTILFLTYLRPMFFPQTWYWNSRNQSEVLFGSGNWVSRVAGHYATDLDWLLTHLMTSFIYFHVMMWFAAWQGLRTSTPGRAILKVLALTILWCVMPLIMVFLLGSYFDWINNWTRTGPAFGNSGTIYGDTYHISSAMSLVSLGFLFSPLFILLALENHCWSQLSEVSYLTLLVNSLCYCGIWWWIRRQVLTRADVILNRTPPARSAMRSTSTFNRSNSQQHLIHNHLSATP